MDGAKYIRFDWAMKRLLRQKANFSVLEGFLTTLLKQNIHIKTLLESESNQDEADDKSNRVDILAENDEGALFLIEVQNNTELAYFQRMLFGVSKLVTEYINRGDNYDKVRKVYSINIIYFPLGQGKDYVYHGTTEFRGMHDGDLLNLSPFQQQRFQAKTVSDLFPEYYILKVNDFNKVAKTPLEEWIHYLNTGDVPDSASAPGLDGVRQFLKLTSMDKRERERYFKHIDDLVILRDNITTSRDEALFEGIKKGIEKGLKKGIAEGEKRKQLEIAGKMKKLGLPAATIAEASGLSEDDIEKI